MLHLAFIIFLSGLGVTFANSIDPEELFANFKTKFNVHYASTDEEANRFQIFKNNLEIIEHRNNEEISAGGSAVHGVTKFADVTTEEFAAVFLPLDPSKMVALNTSIAAELPLPSATTLVDWTNVYTTEVKDQGYCGSCWAFSAAEQLESDAMRQLGKTFILSPEQIVQCDDYSFGCDGGLPEWAFQYVQKAGGIETESDYPYTSGQSGVTGTCSSNKNKYVVTVNGYTKIKGETQMASYVQSTGPLSVCVDASTWGSYTGGILTRCGSSINHSVQAVGVDTGAGYWKIRNSWGTSWGEAGFIRIAYGSNACAITHAPLYTSVAAV